jgi:hypothetical protein
MNFKFSIIWYIWIRWIGFTYKLSITEKLIEFVVSMVYFLGVFTTDPDVLWAYSNISFGAIGFQSLYVFYRFIRVLNKFAAKLR